MSWSVDFCQGWQRIGYTDVFTWSGSTRMLEPGAFSLEAPADVVAWSQFLDAGGRTQSYGPRDVDTVRLVRPNGRIAQAGFVAPLSEGVGGVEVELSAEGETWRWVGPDLWDVLTRRLVWPDPTVEGSSAGWPSTAYDTRTGVASTVAAGFVYVNCGVFALADRQLPVTIDDRLVGASGTWSGRLETVADIVTRICKDAGITCRLSVDFAGTVTVELTSETDLSAFYVFSTEQDLASAQSRRIPADTTFTVAGGQGEGTARTFRVSSTGATGMARRETFSDQSSLPTAAEVQASANVTTRLGALRWSVAAEVSESLTEQVKFGDQVNVGDWITVDAKGERVRVQITGARFDVSAEKQVVVPVLGTAEPDALRGLVRDVSNLSARLDRRVA